MRLITIVFCLLFCSTDIGATVYTFHTSGNYSDVTNWDIYPGTFLDSNDTILIEADIHNMDLFAVDGYILFSEDVSYISIQWMTVIENCQLEFLNGYISIDTYGGLEFYNLNNPIMTPFFTHISINNYGYGVSSYGCPLWETFVTIDYFNDGTQEAEFLECMDGIFFNFGTIEVTWSTLSLNCDLDLASGTISGLQPFSITPYNGTIMQYCNNCTATINNIENLHLGNNTTILGKVILNAP